MSVFNTFTIGQHRPHYAVALVVISVVLTFLIQRYAYLKTTQVQQQQIKQYQQLDDAYQSLRTDNKELSDTLILRNTSTDSQKYELAIQQATILKLEQQLSTLQKQLTSLNKELVFYQTITQGDRPQKLQIRELELRADSADPTLVHYRLIITQGAKINQALTGTIEIIVNAIQHQTSESVLVAAHPLQLRHVQLIEGQIKLTEKTMPKTITIAIIQNGKELLTQLVNWQLSPSLE